MPIIEVNHVTKEYRLGQLTSLKQGAINALNRLAGRPVVHRQPFKALDDVSFSVERGEVLGIIGHNGAGKSTLLKLLANISKPTHGSVSVRGKVAPLIEVGAGLVPDLTGRENIFLNGAILGIPKAEIRRRFDDIVAFAELEQFIDTPIKRYSSGMQVRLGFSIATSVESDILIVDEVLAVGDLAFQRKCFDRIQHLIKRQNRTVLVVSHNIKQLEQIAHSIMLLEHGKILSSGASATIATKYLDIENARITENSKRTLAESKEQTDLHAINVRILNSQGEETNHLTHGNAYTFKIDFSTSRPLSRIVTFIGIHTTDFVRVSSNENFTSPHDYEIGEHSIEFTTTNLQILPGAYSLRIWIGSIDGIVEFSTENISPFRISSERFDIMRQQGAGLVSLCGTWSHDRNSCKNIVQQAIRTAPTQDTIIQTPEHLEITDK